MKKSKETILLIDPDEHVANSLCSSLSSEGFTVFVAGDPADGLGRFIECKPDFVFLDMDRSPEAGLIILKDICAADPGVQVIGLSSDHARALESVRHGARDCLRKPLDMSDLLGSIDTIRTRKELLKISSEPDIECVQAEEKRLVFGNDTRNLPYIINQAVSNAPAAGPEREMLKMALSEIVLNAIEHGNLGITMEEKAEATKEGTYQELMGQRLNDPRYARRVVTLDVLMDRESLVYTVTDQGDGFDYRGMVDSDPQDHIGSGLGIFIARSFFSEISYEGCGNRVKLVYRKSAGGQCSNTGPVNHGRLFHKLLDTLPSGLMVLSADGRVIVWNDASEQITSISRSAIVGAHRDELGAEVSRLLDPGSDEVLLRRQDHDCRHIRKSIHHIELGAGTTNTVVVFFDITERLKKSQEMEVLLMETAETKDLMEEQAARLAMTLADVDGKNEIIQAQNKKMVDELKMAARLQKSLLPNIYENINGVSISSKYIPSIHIGGDLYDVVDLGQGMTGFVIADVSGHGVAAALVSCMFKMSFHALATNVASPKILFHMLNQEFKPILAEEYITAFYLLADCTTRTIVFANAGHPTPLLYRKRTAEVIELDTDGFFLGMFDDGAYEESTLSGIEEGDALLLYTDCIIETENEQGEPFGKTRLKELFARTIRQYHGQEVIDQIEAEVRRFNACETFDDDFTVLLLEFWEQAMKVCPDSPDGDDISSGGFIEF